MNASSVEKQSPVVLNGKSQKLDLKRFIDY